MSPDDGHSRAAHRRRLDAVLDGALLHGVELEPTYRVLSATIEPQPGRVVVHGDDPRVLVVAHPVSTLLATLREDLGGTGIVRTFEASDLPHVVAALDDVRLAAPCLGLPEPRPGTWGPSWSLEGRSHAPDGTAETLTLSVADATLRLDLFARCDVVELRHADGRPIDLGGEARQDDGGEAAPERGTGGGSDPDGGMLAPPVPPDGT
jgi:hypothetical protein